MGFLSRLHFGCTTRFRTDWKSSALAGNPPEEIVQAFSEEGIELHSGRWRKDRLQVVFSLSDQQSCDFAVQRLKGRFSYAMRQLDSSFPGFSPHFFLRSLGQNTKAIVSEYIQGQVDRSDLVDPLYRKRMKELRFIEESVTEVKTRHQGVYDVFTHLVLVTAGRYRMRSPEARAVFHCLCEAAPLLGADPMDVSIMPDHAHMMVRWPQKISASELLEGIKVESGNLLRRTAFWNNGGYVGTVGPYPLKVALKGNRREGWFLKDPNSR